MIAENFYFDSKFFKPYFDSFSPTFFILHLKTFPPQIQPKKIVSKIVWFDFVLDGTFLACLLMLIAQCSWVELSSPTFRGIRILASQESFSHSFI